MKEENLEKINSTINKRDIVIQCLILSLFITALIHIFPIIPTVYPEKGLQVYDIEIPTQNNKSTILSYISINYEKEDEQLPIKKIEAEDKNEDKKNIFNEAEPISLIFYFEETLDIKKMIINQTIYPTERLSLKTYRIILNTEEQTGMQQIKIDKIITQNKVYSVHYQYKIWIQPNTSQQVPNLNHTNQIQQIKNKNINTTTHKTNIYRS